MKTIKGFVAQHQELLSIMTKLSEKLNEQDIETNPSNVRSMLSQLAGKLTLHLAMEDEHLYPFLINHPNQKIKNLSQKFAQEMGSVLSSFKDYKSRWPTPMEIAERPQEFIQETRNIFQLIKRRIDKEDNELYPLVDA